MPPEKQKKTRRLSDSEIILIITITTVVDLFQMVIAWLLDWFLIGIVINWCIDFFMGAFLYFWFNSHNISFKGTKKFIVIGLGLLKIVPFIGDGFPLWILDVIFVVIMTRIEDKVGITNPEAKARAAKRTLTLMAKNKRIGGIMDRTEKGREMRQQILASQRQSLAEKKPDHSLPKQE